MLTNSLAMITEEEKRNYLLRVERADRLSKETIKESPDLDYSTLFHTFMCLDLSPEERLAQCLSRYGHCRF